MTHIATLYTYHEGREKPNLIRYFWDQDTLSLYTQDEYLIDGIQCPENPVQQDPNTNIWNAEEALEHLFGTSQVSMNMAIKLLLCMKGGMMLEL